jgi:hypothetical protein
MESGKKVNLFSFNKFNLLLFRASYTYSQFYTLIFAVHRRGGLE